MVLNFLPLLFIPHHDIVKWEKLNLVMVAKGLYYCDNLGNNNWVEGKVQKDQSLYLKNVNKNDQNSTVFAFDSFNFFVELRHEK